MNLGHRTYAVGPSAHGIMFHYFHSGARPSGQGSIDAAMLDACLDYLGPRRVLSAGEWLWKCRRGRLEGDDLCLTFDDGLKCQYDVALPVLKSRGLTAFWFICSAPLRGEPVMTEVYRLFRATGFEAVQDFYEEFYRATARAFPDYDLAAALARFDPEPLRRAHPYYSIEDLRFRFVRDEALRENEYHVVMARLLADRGLDVQSIADGLWMGRHELGELDRAGHEIGLHSHSHSTVFAQLSVPAQRREYEQNVEALKEATGKTPVSVAHPCNSYGPETLNVLRSLGIELGFRGNLEPGDGSLLEIPRQDHANLLSRMASR
ncbi:MAG: polysaccharide deacetylase family protein [Verrucomicrobia bacterium]|nr:polysaccharide deacetylase family protein [Verrucomicrobiota bacterium]